MNFSLRPHRFDRLPDGAEQDRSRQIKPPEVIARTPNPSASAKVHLRVLVNEQGKVIDSEPASGSASDFAMARKTVETWTFRPARWGSLAIPWYLEVDVPISEPSAPRPAANLHLSLQTAPASVFP